MQSNIELKNDIPLESVPEFLEFSEDTDWVGQFLDHNGFAKTTINTYALKLREFEVFCKGKWEEVRPLNIKHFIKGKKGGDSLKNLYRAALSSFFSFLEDNNDKVDKNPCKGVKRYREETRGEEPHYLTEEDYNKMITSLSKTRMGSGHKFIIEFLATTGLRISETQNIRADKESKESLDQGFFRVTGKGNKSRKVPFPLKMKDEILEKWLNNSGRIINKKPWQIRQSIKRAAALAGIQKVTRKGIAGKRFLVHPHALREFFSSTALKKGMPQWMKERILGHSGGIAEVYERGVWPQILEEYRKAFG